MNIFKTKEEWKKLRAGFDSASIGFVPTMGALHNGHLSLISNSLRQNDITVTSIFVNPTQFDNKEDLQNYPAHLEKDIELLKDLKVDYLFLPAYDYLYGDNFVYKIEESKFCKKLCGLSRPGHFTGVLTVVMKLFNIIEPDKAYFGEKDYQQLKLIEGMTKAFFMDIEIVACPIVRDKDGLALSSRNLRLTESQRSVAPKFYDLLSSEKNDEEIKIELKKNGFDVDYIETIDNRRYGAVFLGNVRLIDNVEL